MKRGKLLLLAVWLCWICIACAVPETTPAALPTETRILAATESILPTTTLAATGTPTAVLPTPTIESARTAVSTADAMPKGEPFTDGFIALTWNPDEEDDRRIMTYQLDFIYPGESPSDWSNETMLEDLYTPYMYPSPDQNKLLLTQYKDSNGDGRIPSLGDADVYDIYLYSVVDETLTLLVENDYSQPESFWFPSPEFFWFPDSDKFTYRFLQKVVEVDSTQPTPTPIISLASGQLYSHALSPNGNWLALSNTSSDSIGIRDDEIDIDVFNLKTKEIMKLAEGVGPGNLLWSPDGFYLAFNESVGRGLYVADMQTLAMTELVTNDNAYILSAWSPDSEWLAYSPDRKNVYIWNSKEEQLEGVYPLESDPETGSQFYLGQIEWLPDSSGVVVTAGTAEKNKLVRLNRENGVFKDLITINRDPLLESESYEQQVNMHDFSPDGQWLLFHADIEGVAGFYVIHRDGGVAHLVLETSRKHFTPFEISWLDADS